MTTPIDIAFQYLDFSELDFFRSNEEHEEVCETETFIDREISLSEIEDFQGVAISVPDSITIENRERLPIFLALRVTRLREWEVPSHSNMSLLATEIGFNEVFLEKVYAIRNVNRRVPRAQRDDKSARPRGVDAEAIITSIERLDGREILELPWRPGRYRLAVVSHDWVSNVVDVTLEGEGEPPARSAPEVFPPPAGPEAGVSGLPTYDSQTGAPVLAADAPPALSIAFHPHPSPEVELLVQGTLSVRAVESHILVEPVTFRVREGREMTARAVVPLTVAVLGVDWGLPLVLRWALPIYSETPVLPGDTLDCSFALDGLVDAEFKVFPGRLAAYAILEDHLFGPVIFEEPGR